MKITNEAIEKAITKQQEQKEFDFCIEWKVCPECASDLECTVIMAQVIDDAPTPPPIRSYKCTKCDFKHPK